MPDDEQQGKVAFATIEEPVQSGADRRRSRRFSCEGFAEIQLLARDTMFRGEIRNLSIHGCFVATRARVHMEKKIPVSIRFSLRNRLYKTEGEVVNIQPEEGIGFEFHHPTARIVDDFAKLVDDFRNAPPRRR